RLELQGGGVGVRADDPPRRGGVDPLGGGPGDERAVTDHVPRAGDVRGGPVRRFLQRRETGLAQAARRLLDGMEGRRRRGDELAQIEGGGPGVGGRGGGRVASHSFIEPSVPRQGSMRSSFASPTWSTTSAAPVSEISLSPV